MCRICRLCLHTHFDQPNVHIFGARDDENDAQRLFGLGMAHIEWTAQPEYQLQHQPREHHFQLNHVFVDMQRSKHVTGTEIVITNGITIAENDACSRNIDTHEIRW